MFLSLKGALGRNPMLNRVGQKLLQSFGGAAAAYSLRNLASNIASVVRVRRASDNSEKDFSAEDISSGAMTEWVNSQIVPPLDIRELDANGERTGDLVEAAAAYSLRNLSASYTGNVVDVRRSSDDAEESFTASEVADGTLEDWVTANQSGRINFASGNNDWRSYDGGANDIYKTNTYGTTSLRQAYDHLADADSIGASPTSDSNYSYKFDSRTSGGYNRTHGLKLETVEDNEIPFNVTFKYFIPEGQPNLSVIYASATSGSLGIKGEWTEVTVRNTNHIQNGALIRSSAFNTTGGLFYLADIRIEADTSNGFVKNWYDQSGNNNHATQGTDASQPKIVDGGSLVSGGIEFDGVNDRLTCSSLYSSDISVFNVVTTSNTVNTANFMRMIHLCDGSDSFQLVRGGNAEVEKLISKNTAFQSGITAFLHGDINGENLISAVTSSTDTDAFVDGSLRSNGSASGLGSGNNTTTTIGARDDLVSSTFFAGSHAEIIIYPSDQSANRAAIETNINNQYDIY